MEVDSWSPELLTGGTRALFGGGHTHPLEVILLIMSM